jgi:adenylosuccinate synthase
MNPSVPFGDLRVLEQCLPFTVSARLGSKHQRGARVEDLPLAARVYILQVETFTGVRVSHVSVGPERSHIFEV